MTLIVHTDGASRGNPGPAAAGFIISDSTGKIIAQSGKFLGTTTNNQAEYHAVLLALNWIKARHSESRRTSGQRIPTGSINFYLDSELVVRQLSGQYKIKSQELLPLAIKIKNLQNTLISPISPISQIAFRSIPRRLNKSADRLVNQILDSKLSSVIARSP